MYGRSNDIRNIFVQWLRYNLPLTLLECDTNITIQDVCNMITDHLDCKLVMKDNRILITYIELPTIRMLNACDPVFKYLGYEKIFIDEYLYTGMPKATKLYLENFIQGDGMKSISREDLLYIIDNSEIFTYLSPYTKEEITKKLVDRWESANKST